jgi:hypothetical protein
VPRLRNQIRVKALLLGLCAAVLATAPMQLACGGSDDKTANEQVRELEIQSLAAYSCMPKNLRRELRTLEKRHDARVRALAEASIPKGATAGTTPPVGFQQTVQSDPLRKRLLRRARAIYGRFSPGGEDYDPGCYLREREEARRRIENPGATESVGTTDSGTTGG